MHLKNNIKVFFHKSEPVMRVSAEIFVPLQKEEAIKLFELTEDKTPESKVFLEEYAVNELERFIRHYERVP